VPLSDNEKDLIQQLQRELTRTRRQDILMQRYYQGRQRVEQLGMAIPPDMRRFLVITNRPRVVVDTLVARQQIRAMILPGEETADPTLRAIADANNLHSHVKMYSRDAKVYGRAFMSVGANENNPELPLMRVEPPMSMAALVDSRTETMECAARFYRDRRSSSAVSSMTLYQPGLTKTVERGKNGWEQVGDDVEHDYDVPVVMHLNRRLSGEWVGESEMSDVIPISDAAARSLTNLQFAQEAHGIPRMWMTGVAKGDFVDEAGKPIPQFEAYFDAIQMLTSKDAKIGQLDAADLKNFETSMRIYGQQAATVTGYPGRYFGLTTANPASEGAINADESVLVHDVEDDNGELGMTLGWASGLAYQFATDKEIEGNRVKVDWFNPATPTVAQRMDATVKAKQSGILSREGSWDELGWSEARKARERAYFAEEGESDPELAAARALTGNAPAVPAAPVVPADANAG
jgi:hypothetical protein